MTRYSQLETYLETLSDLGTAARPVPARTKPLPHCSCSRARKLAGARHQDTLVLTASADKETCDYCGYYVCWTRPEAAP
jgi:hypothetical protein